MLQNKIYQNFFLEILKTFLSIIAGLSIISLTVRAVNFLDLIIDNGYPLITYFQYSFLNLFGIAPKFIPLAFIISLFIFIVKHLDDNEFIILWTSGVKKITVTNLFFITSIFVITIYLFLSLFLTPLALNKSRSLLSNDQLNSFLPTIRAQNFNDSFKGFTFIVDKKYKNELKNIFLHDTGNNLKKMSSNIENITSTTIIAKKGIVEDRVIYLLDGRIISTKGNNENEVAKFDQLNIDLGNLVTTTIKQPKLQEISTLKLLSCFLKINDDLKFCNKETKKEIFPNLIRRIILPFYIPIFALIGSFLLLKKKNFFTNKISIMLYSFILLVLVELFIRYTGLSYFLRLAYVFTPFVVIIFLYFFLNYKFLNESKSQ
tara:strand:- start:5280 stop:6401 length:1122 start_codon:yes stop_codon:yes gene_type:complete